MKRAPVILGRRPRPRVAVVGAWSGDDIDALDSMFETLEVADVESGLNVPPREVDLLVAKSSDPVLKRHSSYCDKHAILFGNPVPAIRLPDQNEFGRQLEVAGSAAANEYTVTAIPGYTGALLQRYVAGLDTARGRPLLVHQSFLHNVFPPGSKRSFGAPQSPSGAVIQPHGDTGALVVCERRQWSNNFLFWLAAMPGNCVEWVSALTRDWAIEDRSCFANVLPWTAESEWMTREEIEAQDGLAAVARSRATALAEFDEKQRIAESRLEQAREAASSGLRRILTTQKDELVQEVIACMRWMGFEVTDVDAETPDGEAKRHDLELRYGDWIAIVEVKGHRKRTAGVAEVQQVANHVVRFVRRTGTTPSAAVLVVNAQLERPPAIRDTIFGGDLDGARAFGEGCPPGVIVDTRVLFRLRRDFSPDEARAILIAGRGLLATTPSADTNGDNTDGEYS